MGNSSTTRGWDRTPLTFLCTPCVSTLPPSSTMSNIPRLRYFDVRGRAEPMRMCFVASNKKFEDERVSGEKFAEEKGDPSKIPFGQLPVLQVGGLNYGESTAIATYVAKTTGMAGKTDEDLMKTVSVYCLCASLMEAIVGIHFCQDEKEKAEKTKKLTEETAPKFLTFFEDILKANGTGFVVGKELTLGDCAIQDICVTTKKMIPTILDKYPGVQKMIEAVETNKFLKKYLADRKDSGL